MVHVVEYKIIFHLSINLHLRSESLKIHAYGYHNERNLKSKKNLIALLYDMIRNIIYVVCNT